MPPRFGLFPVRSPLLGESRLISFPPGTEMFQFPGLAPFRVTDVAAGRVSPFGHPGLTARVQLPQAYRSLPRPSSPLDAKASTVCLIAFDLKSIVARPGARDARPTERIGFLTPARPPLARTSSAPSICQLSKSQVSELADRVRATSEFFRPASEEAAYSRLQKGGDPAAGSPTATLLRLRPSH